MIRETKGLIWGALGVIAFSLTLPATRAAVPELGSTIVGLGRALVAALLAGLLLLALRERPPARQHWPGLAIVVLGVVIGFPLCTALALRSVPAIHGAVVMGLVPAATAVMAVLRAGERPPQIFWFACLGGIAASFIFAAVEGAGHPQAADLFLFAAVALVALGYAEGGRLARELGGWRVICWALLFAVPFLVIPVALAVADRGVTASPSAWIGFAYVSVVSMFLGFFAWYHGLALGGIARVGQVQLLQPALTLGWGALLLGESVSAQAILASLLVVASVGLARWSWKPQPSSQTTKAGPPIVNT